MPVAKSGIGVYTGETRRRTALRQYYFGLRLTIAQEDAIVLQLASARCNHEACGRPMV